MSCSACFIHLNLLCIILFIIIMLSEFNQGLFESFLPFQLPGDAQWPDPLLPGVSHVVGAVHSGFHESSKKSK